VGDKMEVYVGDSRDIVVTQRKMKDQQINIRYNTGSGIVLFDTTEEIVAKIENFKDKPAKLTMIQHIEGQWDMEECNMKYERKNAGTLKFEIEMPARTDKGPGKKELVMNYHRRNVRPGYTPAMQ
jgi:hypothetical protein